jgi:hypothetical protein
MLLLKFTARIGGNQKILKKIFLQKIEEDFYNDKDIEMPPIDLVYFDCFGARVQPEGRALVKMVAEKWHREVYSPPILPKEVYNVY